MMIMTAPTRARSSGKKGNEQKPLQHFFSPTNLRSSSISVHFCCVLIVFLMYLLIVFFCISLVFIFLLYCNFNNNDIEQAKPLQHFFTLIVFLFQKKLQPLLKLLKLLQFFLKALFLYICCYILIVVILQFSCFCILIVLVFKLKYFNNNKIEQAYPIQHFFSSVQS